MNYILETF